MRIATWNINGIKARLPLLLDWLRMTDPDVAVLQEIKSTDDTFPADDIRKLGYLVETHGQKGFNGVALLSKKPFERIARGLPGDEADTQARFIEGTTSLDDGTELTIAGLYLPNGNPAPGEKYDYKRAWMARLEAHAANLIAQERAVVMLGDFNVIPQPEDAYDPPAWRDDALFRPETREDFRRLIVQGWTDAVRARMPHGEGFTFWDYQAGAWPKNHGIRIDHILLSPQAADRLGNVWIDREMRDRERPSDHVPVLCEIEP